MGVVTRRSTMTLFSDGADQYSHRVRIVLAEKGVTVDIVESDPANIPEEVSSLNPYNELPLLVDRELVLFHANVMMEYLDERFPHPPLLPVYPVARAETRKFIQRVERDWSEKVDALMAGTIAESKLEKMRKELSDEFTALAPVFAEKPFFMSDEFSLIDCVLAPIFWRLPAMGVELNAKTCKPLLAYADRMFERESFQASLSEKEQEMRLTL